VQQQLELKQQVLLHHLLQEGNTFLTQLLAQFGLEEKLLRLGIHQFTLQSLSES
jgi:hypothetical protein